MTKELIALEQAVATLEMLFQSIEFAHEDEANAIWRRLTGAERRLRDLARLCSPPEEQP